MVLVETFYVKSMGLRSLLYLGIWLWNFYGYGPQIKLWIWIWIQNFLLDKDYSFFKGAMYKQFSITFFFAKNVTHGYKL